MLLGCAPEEDPGGIAAPIDDDRGRSGPPIGLPQSGAFPLGVASGDVDSVTGRVVLWARHDAELALRVAVWVRGGALVVEANVGKGEGGFVHTEVGNLSPGVWHEYAFVEIVQGKRIARSPIGRFRAPYGADESPELLLGTYACTKQGRDFSTLNRAAERELDAVLLLGDGSYNDDCSTLSQYRSKWTANLATPAYRAIRSQAPFLATWDDHEVANNWDPEKIGAAQLAAATQTFFEHQPLSRLASPNRIWRSRRFGTTLEVFVLDCKGERRSSRNEYVSREQLEWLKSGLASSPCAFKLIMSSLPIGNFPWPWDFVKHLRWWGFPAQRQEILRFIDDRAIEGVVWLAGDFHVGTVGRVDEDGVGAGQFEVLCGPGAQRGNPLVYTLNDRQWPFATAESNMTFFHLDPDSGRAVVQHVAGDGEVLHETTLFA
jgi:alkaline phosphatase D